MPRRAKLSLPVYLKDASEGYALWDSNRNLVDYNQAFAEMAKITFVDESGLDWSSIGSGKNIEISSIKPAASVFCGEQVKRLTSAENGSHEIYEINTWPVTDQTGAVVAAMGRLVRIVNPEELMGYDPTKVWGHRLHDELLKRRAQPMVRGLEKLVGTGADYELVVKRINTAIVSRCNLVVLGEPSTGRHHVARLIHGRSQVESGHRLPLVPLDPRSLPVEILAHDFLGIEPATSLKQLRAVEPNWRIPAGSILLMEEIVEIPELLQQYMVWAPETVRWIGLGRSTACLRTLDNRFRAKLETLVIELKPLRDRLEELPLLAQSVLERIQAGVEKKIDGFTPSALDTLRRYDWPGNWREFNRVIEEASAKAKGPMIDAEDIPATIQGSFGGAWMNSTGPSGRQSLETALEKTRKVAVEAALAKHPDNKAAAAKSLGVSRAKLYRLIEEFKLDQ